MNIDYDTLVDRYYKKIYKLCLFYLKDEHEAEDLVQEVFLKIFKKKSGFKGDSSIYTWVYRVSVNTIINYIKRKNLVQFFYPGNGNNIEKNCSEMEVASMELDPALILENDETRNAVLLKLERCMKLLSHREKTAFYLFYYENLKQKEISEIMNTSVSAVESLIHKAMKKIKKNIHLHSQS